MMTGETTTATKEWHVRLVRDLAAQGIAAEKGDLRSAAPVQLCGGAVWVRKLAPGEEMPPGTSELPADSDSYLLTERMPRPGRRLPDVQHSHLAYEDITGWWAEEICTVHDQRSAEAAGVPLMPWHVDLVSDLRAAGIDAIEEGPADEPRVSVAGGAILITEIESQEGIPDEGEYEDGDTYMMEYCGGRASHDYRHLVEAAISEAIESCADSDREAS